MIVWKHPELELEFESLDERLQHIIYALASFVKYRMNKDLTITSIYRDQEGSVHKYYHGADFRICPKDGESVFTDQEIVMIEDFCEHYVYDLNRMGSKTIKVHDAGSGLHGHLQVDGNTDYTPLTKESYYVE